MTGVTGASSSRFCTLCTESALRHLLDLSCTLAPTANSGWRVLFSQYSSSAFLILGIVFVCVPEIRKDKNELDFKVELYQLAGMELDN